MKIISKIVVAIVRPVVLKFGKKQLDGQMKLGKFLASSKVAYLEIEKADGWFWIFNDTGLTEIPF